MSPVTLVAVVVPLPASPGAVTVKVGKGDGRVRSSKYSRYGHTDVRNDGFLTIRIAAVRRGLLMRNIGAKRRKKRDQMMRFMIENPWDCRYIITRPNRRPLPYRSERRDPSVSMRQDSNFFEALLNSFASPKGR